jgi:N6-L-threonylcarbamoyladenine synthase
VNHLEGHVHAVVMEAQLDGHPIEWPAVALIASGGHTHLFEAATAASSASGGAALAEDRGQRPTPVDRGAATAASSASTRLRYRLLGRTRDDAAGEAFDKVAKLLGFSYPGGPVLDALAPFGDPRGVKFTLAKMKGNPLDFSFSGLKTAVLRWTESHDTGAEIERRRELARATPHPTREDWRAATSQRTLDLIASFQHTVVGELLRRARAACEETGARALIVSGGVACNRGLRKSAASADIPCPVYFPTPALSTDNAVMIAAAAHPMLLSGQTSGWDLKARASLALA